MDVQLAKILSECLLLLGADILEVLVSEHHHATLGEQER